MPNMTVSSLTSRAVDAVSGVFRAQGARGVKSPVHSAVLGPGSNYSAFATINSVYNSYEPLAYKLPWEVLDWCEMLSTYNSDFAQAVDNVRTLANSGHELFVAAGSDLATKRVKDYLEEFARTVQERNGGVDGLVDKLLDQAATYGAMCGEWILSEDMSEVVDFADINPKSIRFFWNESTQNFDPYQKVTALQAQQVPQDRVIQSCVKLNQMTFHYFAFDAAPQSPYGTPPFISALEPIGIQRDMIANMSQIVKKIGLLGLIDLAVERLPPKPGETDEQYAARAGGYLDSYVEAAEQMVRDGGMVHFDDVIIKSTNVAGNAAGATNIFKQNEEQVFSGLKSMPSIQGRSYSTTETYAGVAYDIMIRNTNRYQRACKRMIESGYWLASGLAKYQPKSISISFHDNKTLHRLQDAQATALEIKNAALLWKSGVINQTGFAQLNGYSNIDTPLEEVPDELIGGKGADLNSGDNEDQGNQSLDDTGGGKPNNQNNNSVRSFDDED